MSIAGIVRTILFRFVRLISSFCSWIVDLVRYGRQSQRIGELPLYVRAQSTDDVQQPFLMHSDSNSPTQSPFLQSTSFDNSHSAQTADSWGTWAEQEQQQTVNSKIAEYRNQLEQQRLQKQQQKRQAIRGGPTAQSMAETQNNPSASTDDLFSDLQPTLKATKMYRVRDPNAEAVPAPRQSLFEVRDDPFVNRQHTSELGDLDLNAIANGPDDSFGNWDANEEIAGLDEALHEQRKREIVEKQRQRREEHERRLNQKRGMKSS
ncbi:hypothetical protein M3Y98_00725200 [Aphelenchoides besseyi]|nr:hypothetical protein M3Y98_00725200 [Aphelenchoides besseyi]KAI6210198.1 hypothetical protein M3Y96_00302200 [Aphelenchoides besseyi]